MFCIPIIALSSLTTTNGESSMNITKPLSTDSTISSSTPKLYHVPAASQSPKTDYRSMRDLLSNENENEKSCAYLLEKQHLKQQKQREQEREMQQMNHHHQNIDKRHEKSERQSPYSNQTHPNIMSSNSPMQLSADSNSGDGLYEDSQSE